MVGIRQYIYIYIALILGLNMNNKHQNSKGLLGVILGLKELHAPLSKFRNFDVTKNLKIKHASHLHTPSTTASSISIWA